MKILGLGENVGFGKKFGFGRFCVLLFAFEFLAKNSEFFRFKYLNFPPKILDSIGEEEEEDMVITVVPLALQR